jgi:UDP-N-acetylmuramyl pentapeptide synthase
MKDFVKHFRFRPNTRIVMVTGTGGKTTTTGMLSQLIQSAGKTICTNALGANMDRGIATALIQHADASGLVDVDYVILEVDERYLRLMTKLIKPHVILMTNVLKDQSQRNGEPGVILRKLREAISDDIQHRLVRISPSLCRLLQRGWCAIRPAQGCFLCLLCLSGLFRRDGICI